MLSHTIEYIQAEDTLDFADHDLLLMSFDRTAPAPASISIHRQSVTQGSGLSPGSPGFG
jgi:hypothetical protein